MNDKLKISKNSSKGQAPKGQGPKGQDPKIQAPKSRAVRADAQRNLDALLETAKVVFATAGVDAPMREIADKAGVGLGTIYRHFPQRSDLIAAVFRHEVDACTDAAFSLAKENEPAEALAKWMQRYSAFFATKRGLAPALHSGEPAYKNLRAYFEERVRPALVMLLESATAAGQIRENVDAEDILYAVAHLSMTVPDGGSDHCQRMVALLVDGLRYGAKKKS